VSYVVTGPLATVKLPDGKLRYLYKDAPVPEGVDAEQLERLESHGLIAEVPEPEEPASSEQAQAPARPSVRASKATWVEFWVGQGMDPAEAEKLNRDDLATLEAVPVTAPASAITE
jgi:hypothetical protein